MKKIFSLLFVVMAVFSSCYQDMILEEDSDGVQTRSSASSNAFTFIDECYMVWNDNSYMLDYELIGSSDVPLDKPIDILCRIWYTNGTQEDEVFARIPAGVKSYWDENSTLGESLGSSSLAISSVAYIGYSYSGSMEIMGLENMDTYPWDRGETGGSGSGNTPSNPPVSITSLRAEWTKGSYDLGGELKELNYFNVEGGMGRSYTLISRGSFVMEVVLQNDTNKEQTFQARDFAIQRKEWNVVPYSKATSMYLENSNTAHAITSITIPADGSKTVYFYTNDLFYEGNGVFDYITTPPYHLQLSYKNEAICGDDVNVDYKEYNQGWLG